MCMACQSRYSFMAELKAYGLLPSGFEEDRENMSDSSCAPPAPAPVADSSAAHPLFDALFGSHRKSETTI